MRNWNSGRKESRRRPQIVCIVPMRNWNDNIASSCASSAAVCIVPMRNWNISAKRWGLVGHGVRLYRTYEELKHEYQLIKSLDCIAVCIVPMRNWNFLTPPNLIIDDRSSLYRTYEELKPASASDRFPRTQPVCIVPMRNWNYPYNCVIQANTTFVSYLWGIETIQVDRQWFPSASTGLYRTYEELKLAAELPHSFEAEACLYRTYEELKLQSIFKSITIRKDGLYRTYEELKLKANTIANKAVSTRFVSYLWGIETTGTRGGCRPGCAFVSYLWGIETAEGGNRGMSTKSLYRTYEELKPVLRFRRLIAAVRLVCIVPMRNWNNFFLIYRGGRKPRLYRTYEELKQVRAAKEAAGREVFVSYLWGIETGNTTRSDRACSSVCIVPMRNWNWAAAEHAAGTIFVCIVPMRNWNPLRRVAGRSVLGRRFVSYLWGIETRNHGQVRFFGFSVCIVPMRNWN